MSATNERTTAYYDALEKIKSAELQEMEVEMAVVESQRSDLILLISEMPNDKTVKKDLETIEKTRKDLALEIESIEALLGAIPERRNFARAREIEKEITILENFDNQLKQAIPEIDATAEAHALEARRYLDICQSLLATFPRTFRIEGMNFSVKNALVAAFLKSGLKDWVKIGGRAESMTSNLERNPMRMQITERIQQKRELAARLRSEEGSSREICMECGGAIVLEFGGNKKVCRECALEVA